MTRLFASLFAALGLFLGLIAIDYAVLGGATIGQLFSLDTIMQVQALGIASVICFALAITILALDLYKRIIDHMETTEAQNNRLIQANLQNNQGYTP